MVVVLTTNSCMHQAAPYLLCTLLTMHPTHYAPDLPCALLTMCTRRLGREEVCADLGAASPARDLLLLRCHLVLPPGKWWWWWRWRGRWRVVACGACGAWIIVGRMGVGVVVGVGVVECGGVVVCVCVWAWVCGR